VPFATHHLRYAFEGQGELGFGVWTYATNDPLEEVLEEGYFNAAHGTLRAGDLLFVGSTQRPIGSPWLDRTTATRRALLMVARVEVGRPITTRLVQDYGRPEDPSAPLGGPAPRKRPAGTG
jgi:hypothetical protein